MSDKARSFRCMYAVWRREGQEEATDWIVGMLARLDDKAEKLKAQVSALKGQVTRMKRKMDRSANRG